MAQQWLLIYTDFNTCNAIKSTKPNQTKLVIYNDYRYIHFPLNWLDGGKAYSGRSPGKPSEGTHHSPTLYHSKIWVDWLARYSFTSFYSMVSTMRQNGHEMFSSLFYLLLRARDRRWNLIKFINTLGVILGNTVTKHSVCRNFSEAAGNAAA